MFLRLGLHVGWQDVYKRPCAAAGTDPSAATDATFNVPSGLRRVPTRGLQRRMLPWWS